MDDKSMEFSYPLNWQAGSPHDKKRIKAKKGERGMPGRQEPKKDVAHCEKFRGVVCRQ